MICWDLEAGQNMKAFLFFFYFGRYAKPQNVGNLFSAFSARATLTSPIRDGSLLRNKSIQRDGICEAFMLLQLPSL